LQHRLGVVRCIDVASELGVSKPSVSIAVKKLRSEGLADMDESRNLVLTPLGLAHASAVWERHVLLQTFLTDVLQIDEETAHSDSCRLEHVVSAEMLHKIKELYA